MTQLVIIAIYLCIVLSLGLFASRMFRGTSSDYMLASHSIAENSPRSPCLRRFISRARG